MVYIATTHPYHHEQALLAIEAGKPVLIEKPVCLNAARRPSGVRAAAERPGCSPWKPCGCGPIR